MLCGHRASPDTTQRPALLPPFTPQREIHPTNAGSTAFHPSARPQGIFILSFGLPLEGGRSGSSLGNEATCGAAAGRSPAAAPQVAPFPSRSRSGMQASPWFWQGAIGPAPKLMLGLSGFLTVSPGLPLEGGAFGVAPRERERRGERGLLRGGRRAQPGGRPSRGPFPSAFSFRDAGQPLVLARGDRARPQIGY